MAARRSEEMAASGDSAAMVATAAACFCQSRSAALAALLVLPERVALAATLLGDRAATAVTAATVGRLMAASRLVAMAAMELRLGRVMRWNRTSTRRNSSHQSTT